MLRQMVELVTQPGVVSLAGGLPDPALFPAREYAEALHGTLKQDSGALQYRPPLERLKEQIVELMALRGVACRREQIVLTTGAQQGIDILGRMLLQPGSEVAYEELTFVGIHQAAAPTGSLPLTMSTDLSTGIDVERFEAQLAQGHRPSLLYVIPDAHNPLGVSISPPKRQRLVELARGYGVPIVEDDPYGLLSFDGGFEPPLRSLDDDWVFYLGSFSKILAPGLRLGWIVAPERLVGKITIVKEAIDLECSILTQRAVSRLLGDLSTESEVGFCFQRHLERLRSTYSSRRDAMLEGLESWLPADCRWSRPAGGMFVWVEAPAPMDSMALLHASLERERVAFVPGSALSIDGSAGKSALRLSFASLEPERILEAVKSLGSCMTRFQKKSHESNPETGSTASRDAASSRDNLSSRVTRSEPTAVRRDLGDA